MVEGHMDDIQEPQVCREQGDKGVKEQSVQAGFLGNIGT